MSFNEYEIDRVKYIKMLPSYLQGPGTSIYNSTYLKSGILEEFKNRVVEFWELFDLDRLELKYRLWRENEEDLVGPDNVDDQKWIFTDFLENLCKSFNITREYYSFYANNPENFQGETNWKAPGNVLLSNQNMIRLLKMNRAGAGFNGTRESLEEIITNVFRNKITELGEENLINFFIKTDTENHATLRVYLVRPRRDSYFWTEIDDYLAYDGRYFLNLLGIEVLFDIVDSDTLIYDSGNYVNYDDVPENNNKYRYK